MFGHSDNHFDNQHQLICVLLLPEPCLVLLNEKLFGGDLLKFGKK